MKARVCCVVRSTFTGAHPIEKNSTFLNVEMCTRGYGRSVDVVDHRLEDSLLRVSLLVSVAGTPSQVDVCKHNQLSHGPSKHSIGTLERTGTLQSPRSHQFDDTTILVWHRSRKICCLIARISLCNSIHTTWPPNTTGLLLKPQRLIGCHGKVMSQSLLDPRKEWRWKTMVSLTTIFLHLHHGSYH